jgi:hypothetical protein
MRGYSLHTKKNYFSNEKATPDAYEAKCAVDPREVRQDTNMQIHCNE